MVEFELQSPQSTVHFLEALEHLNRAHILLLYHVNLLITSETRAHANQYSHRHCFSLTPNSRYGIRRCYRVVSIAACGFLSKQTHGCLDFVPTVSFIFNPSAKFASPCFLKGGTWLGLHAFAVHAEAPKFGLQLKG